MPIPAAKEGDMWTPQFIGISVGCFLIIIAIMGGGVEVKEIKIPRLSGWARFGSAVLGAAIAMASSGIEPADTQAAAYSPPAIENASGATANLAMAETPEPAEESNSQEAVPEAQVPPTPAAPSGYVTITDRLAQSQEYERIRVYINGTAVGRLAVDQNERMDRLQVPADGSLVSYYLEGTQRGDLGTGPVVLRLEGEGTIRLRPGTVYEMSLADEQTNPDDDIMQIELRPSAGSANAADQADGSGDD
jgi:hypothetical protein